MNRNEREDPFFYEFYGDSTKMHIFGDAEFDEYGDNPMLRADAYFRDEDRWGGGLPSFPFEFRFRAERPSDKRIKPEFLDCHSVLMNDDPVFNVRSFASIVSRRAADALSCASDEIEFLPCVVANCPQDYFVLWIKKVFDFIDRDLSSLREDPPGCGKFGVRKPVFSASSLDARYCARLPLFLYDSISEYATRDLFEVVKKNKLSGFVFVDPVTGKEVK